MKKAAFVIGMVFVASACTTTAAPKPTEQNAAQDLVVKSNPVLEYTGVIADSYLIGSSNSYVDPDTGEVSSVESDVMVTNLYTEEKLIAFYGLCSNMGDHVVVSVKKNEDPRNQIYELLECRKIDSEETGT